MTDEKAFELIKQALEKTQAGSSEKVTMETDLIADGIVDSLDSMNFLFELETALGKSITSIDETFDDFKVTTLVDLVVKESA
ncbi:acyl carrier protein [Actibacterium ureilyticum]|uniref:acyl carrier protein n=1 Tax=Actibacterium ureilyticum TaxID=1590614 RepID=UPI000BAAEB58|nr:acyl carrier protein [Actibacterium ureilyticum]